MILDLGANIGMSALYFSAIWPAAHIVAVEPDADNFTLLRSNTSTQQHIHPLHAAVANADGAVRIVDKAEESWAKRTECVEEASAADVAAVSVPTLMGLCPTDARPFLVKVDIEGFEKNLFAANTDWVAKFPLVIVEIHDWRFPGSATARPFFHVMAQQARDFLIVGESILCIAAE